jgi:serine phosphatase RsbU (regulator of sigma subunit)
VRKTDAAGSTALVRPRAVVVGALPGPRVRERLRAIMDLETVGLAEAGPTLLSQPLDVLLLDGSLPTPALARLVAGLAPPRGADPRPAVLVVSQQGRRARLETALSGHVDDYVNAGLGDGEVLERVRAALRVRGYLAELSRKNVELAALYDRVEAMAHRMAEELRLAANVQRSLLPPPLHHPCIDVAREFMPFREIGGDFYDLVPLSNTRLALGIGDVMGKGVPAALLAANLKACVRAQLQSGDVRSEDLVGRVGSLFREVSPKGLFATLFFWIFDLERGSLEYVNAGHDYPFLVRPNGTVRDLVEGGPVLGLLEHAQYERGSVVVETDDLFVFYSDGVTDRGNGDGESYGVERLKEAARRCRADAARIVLYTLLGEVQGWSGGTPAEDDMTLVVAKLR